MSTKIYDAFRVRPAVDIWAVLQDIQRRAEKNVVKRLRAFYIEEMEGIDPESPAYREARAKDPKGSEAGLRLRIVHDLVREGYRETSTRLQRSRYDLDVSVALTHHETGYYLRAFCDSFGIAGGSLDFLRRHPDLEDFHYQNQTDRPKPLTEGEWEERRKIWDEMMDKHGHLKCQLVLEVSSWQGFHRIDPWYELLQKFHDNPPVFPTREELVARVLRKLDAIETVTAKPGCIVCTTKDGQTATLAKSRKPAQKGQWVTQIGD